MQGKGGGGRGRGSPHTQVGAATPRTSEPRTHADLAGASVLHMHAPTTHLEGAGLVPRAVHGEGLPLQCLHDEVGHHAAVLGVHPRAIGVEHTRNTHLTQRNPGKQTSKPEGRKPELLDMHTPLHPSLALQEPPTGLLSQWWPPKQPCSPSSRTCVGQPHTVVTSR